MSTLAATAQEPDDDTLYGIVAAHDDLDIAVCLAAIELDLPMLALCRGMQVLNVALGGTLHARHRQQRPLDARAHGATSPKAR